MVHCGFSLPYGHACPGLFLCSTPAKSINAFHGLRQQDSSKTKGESVKSTFREFYASIAVLAVLIALLAASPSSALPARVIDNKETIVLRGNVHPFARPQFDQGETEPSLRMERMILALRLSGDKQSELETFLSDLHDPTSAHLSPMAHSRGIRIAFWTASG